MSVYKRHIIPFLIFLVPALGVAQSFSAHNVIDASFGSYSVSAADLNGDGDMDVFVASSNGANDAKIAWYENDGSETFASSAIIDPSF